MINFFKYIAVCIFAFSVCACSSGFNQQKASQLLQQENLSEEDYSTLLKLYDAGMDDAIDAAGKKDDEISPALRNEMLTIFEIGMRLSKDEDKLSDAQKNEFDRINKKGTDSFDVDD